MAECHAGRVTSLSPWSNQLKKKERKKWHKIDVQILEKHEYYRRRTTNVFKKKVVSVKKKPQPFQSKGMGVRFLEVSNSHSQTYTLRTRWYRTSCKTWILCHGSTKTVIFASIMINSIAKFGNRGFPKFASQICQIWQICWINYTGCQVIGIVKKIGK